MFWSIVGFSLSLILFEFSQGSMWNMENKNILATFFSDCCDFLLDSACTWLDLFCCLCEPDPFSVPDHEIVFDPVPACSLNQQFYFIFILLSWRVRSTLQLCHRPPPKTSPPAALLLFRNEREALKEYIQKSVRRHLWETVSSSWRRRQVPITCIN